ncbi:unnamed protein product [Knipowitschia caucasica]
MESKFSRLRQRDNSVSMLRVKMSRRRSQSQKENRQHLVNTRRGLDALQELDMSALDASMTAANMSIIKDKKKSLTALPKNVAGEERLKQLQRWKERKALEKEKEQREKSNKGVFKTGLYHPKDFSICPLPSVLAGSGRGKEMGTKAAPAQSTRVTRSMKQQPVQKPLKMQDVNTAAKKCQPPVEGSTRSRIVSNKPVASKTKEQPDTRGQSTRSGRSKPPVTAAPVMKDKPKDKCADVRTTRSKVTPLAEEKFNDGVPAVLEEHNLKPDVPTLQSNEDMEQAAPDPVEVPKSVSKASFAPDGFLFRAPDGLSSIKLEPLTPHSADAFLTPSSSFTLPPAPTFDEDHKSIKESLPPKSPPTSAADAEEPQHDVPFFRSEIVNETERLMELCTHWESKVEDESIPEEMRDRMRTAVGQARLLMKERFRQFSGLVDDCDFGRGEKITTCTDLQGFWDMVYYQVEDVHKKFDALKAAEGQSWLEEQKPVPRQRKVVKKSADAPGPSKPSGTKAGAKSRLAAAKAAMKARQQAAESGGCPDAEPSSQNTDPLVFNAGLLKVVSPSKPGSVRRSSRLSAVPSPSPNCLTPRRVTLRSLVFAHTPVQQPMTTPPCPHSVNKTSPVQSLKATLPQTIACAPVSVTPNKEMSSDFTEQSKNTVLDSGHSVTSITVEEPGSTVANKSDFIQSPNLALSPCKSSVESVSLSFTLSPPAEICSPHAAQNLLSPQDLVTATPDSSAHEAVNIDFERYLQPSQRVSLSPRQPFSMESSMVMDVDMESPKGLPEIPLAQQNAVCTSLPTVPTLSLQSPQTVESALFLFTPDLKDRIRQSVCPSDLMVFTPPHLQE